MKDVFGHELAIGDTVAFMEPGYSYELKTGEIVKFTPKKLVIKWDDGRGYATSIIQTYKFPEQVAKNLAPGLKIQNIW